MEHTTRRPRPNAAAGIALAGLIPCAVAFALAPHDRLLDPLTFVLAAAAVTANIIEVEVGPHLRVSASFTCCLIAAVFLGIAPAVLIALVSEIAEWTADRFDVELLASNCFAAIAPTLLVAVLARELALQTEHGFLFDVGVAGLAITALVANALLATFLTGLCRGTSAVANLRAMPPFFPLIGLNVALAVLVAEAYRSIGIEASIFVVVLILGFSHMGRLLMAAADRSRRLAELSNTRGLLVAQALNAEDRERRSLADRLHDHAVQNLLAARQEIEDAEAGKPGSLVRAHEAIEETVEQLRDAVFDLHPSILEHAGLPAALAAIGEKHASRAEFTVAVSVDPRSVGAADQLVFALCRELIINVAKHARAETVHVRVDKVANGISVEVEDDGIGVSDTERLAAVERGHVGLASAAQRVEALGGSFDVRSAPNQGTTVHATIPVGSTDASADNPTTPAVPGA